MNFWWHGPDFLTQAESIWPVNLIEVQTNANEERKNYRKKNMRDKEEESIENKETPERTMTAVNANNVQSWHLQPTVFSSWQRMVRIRAWVNRFIINCRNADNCICGELTPDEIREAENATIAEAQRESFLWNYTLFKVERNYRKTVNYLVYVHVYTKTA